MIISASRRTDIPAFYSEWFINRIRAGFLLTRNPFNYHQVSRVSLLPDDVDAIVFWTRNPVKLLPHMDELSRVGHRFYFQFTITGYPRTLESKTLNPHKALDVFKKLADNVGAEKVIWRYDPILFSNLLPFEEHIRLFSKLAGELQGYTRRVVISFADFYQKTEKNLKTVDSLVYSDITQNHEICLSLAEKLAEIAHHYDMDIFSCAEDMELTRQGIQHGKCIDETLINDLFGLQLASSKDPGQREACGCVKSIDIGMYNTCLHGCKYCYATFNTTQANTNFKKHNPNSPLLLGNADDVDPRLLQPVIFQQNLF
ncbi:DUF1848 domain-containing protein [Kosakonia radicincitans]|uniref:DUF1848 domain-containing protein n=1 Tax=Kosakonia radicincitans TaxID=283686 RepID=UPI0011EF443B|nr:DUF1848 domain-containing protein [Kosakonia radicincitans]QEM92708.1 DUF1848 domain-containing protein [Kosakonia radicincitans]